MILTFNHNKKELKADFSKPLEIGVSVQRKDSLSSFGIAGADYKTYIDGDFVGNKANGGPCNLERIQFTPHGNSTHTECLGHISLDPHMVNECIKDDFFVSLVCTLSETKEDENAILDFSVIDWENLSMYESLIIRTLPNNISKIHQNYSGKNAPYISASDMQKIVDMGIQHIIIDLPSVDPEWDGGALAAHHVFWNYPENPRKNCSITEFAFIADEVKDGTYLLKLNISLFQSDAAPSRPVIYPIIAG
ncbi:cyclase family protein [Bacteroidia bacterium]|nr:cyclase family protein [Bacteroidia bacterium]